MDREKLKRYLEKLLEQTPNTREAAEIREEFINNQMDRYDDLVLQGETPEAAFHIVVDSIGNISDLFRDLEETEEDTRQTDRQEAAGFRQEESMRQEEESKKSAKPGRKAGSAAGMWIGGLVLLFVIAVIVVRGFRIGGGGYEIWFEGDQYYDYNVVNEQSISAENLEAIYITYSMDDVILRESDTDQIVLKEYMLTEPEESEKAMVNLSGGRLEIKSGKRPEKRLVNGFGYTSPWGYAEILIPESFAGALYVSTASGDIDNSEITVLDRLELSATSGDILVHEINAKNSVSVTTTSGEIEIRKASGTVALSSTSGDIWMEQGEGMLTASATSGEVSIDAYNGSVNIMTTSGDVTWNYGEGEAEISTSSGEVDLDLSRLQGKLYVTTTSGGLDASVAVVEDSSDIKLEASSGDIDLSLPQELGIRFFASTSSGDINTYFDDDLKFSRNETEAEGEVAGSPSVGLNMKSTSGDIYVDRN